jgi:hypothetical protein
MSNITKIILTYAVPYCVERSAGPSSSRRSLRERLALERKMLHRLARLVGSLPMVLLP